MGKPPYHGVVYEPIWVFNLAEENLRVVKTLFGTQQGKERDESANGEDMVLESIEDYLSMNLKCLFDGFTRF